MLVLYDYIGSYIIQNMVAKTTPKMAKTRTSTLLNHAILVEKIVCPTRFGNISYNIVGNISKIFHSVHDDKEVVVESKKVYSSLSHVSNRSFKPIEFFFSKPAFNLYAISLYVPKVLISFGFNNRKVDKSWSGQTYRLQKIFNKDWPSVGYRWWRLDSTPRWNLSTFLGRYNSR